MAKARYMLWSFGKWFCCYYFSELPRTSLSKKWRVQHKEMNGRKLRVCVTSTQKWTRRQRMCHECEAYCFVWNKSRWCANWTLSPGQNAILYLLFIYSSIIQLTWFRFFWYYENWSFLYLQENVCFLTEDLSLPFNTRYKNNQLQQQQQHWLFLGRVDNWTL